MIEALFSWAVPILIGIAFGVVAMDDFKLAKTCFLLSGLIAEAKVVMWGMSIQNGGTVRVLACFLASGLIGVLVMESFRYVDRKREARQKTAQAVQEQTALPSSTASPAPATPTPTAESSQSTPTATPTPQPSPSTPKSRKTRPKKSDLQRRKEQALRDLNYKNPKQ